MKIEMKKIYKSFGAIEAVKDVSFSVEGGEVCALIGENGAGKSTLMNILGGVLPADKGEILIDGQKVSFEQPADSLSSGIAFIHQELNLINDLPIYENMFIGRELKKKGGILDLEKMIEKTQAVFDEMEIGLDPKTMVRDLDTSYKQIVEISRAIMMDASIIIMDEPTTSLTDQEIERVFEMMETLKRQNVGIVFISHKLNEVIEFCDCYTVLRNGELVAEGMVKDVDVDQLARDMVGHELTQRSLERETQPGREVLRAENLSYNNDFKDISFAVHQGEILGVTGLLGDGRKELFQAIFGRGEIESGKLYLNEQEVKIKNTTDALEKGIGYLPRNRKENGIIKDMDIFDNASIVTWPLFDQWGVIDQEKQEHKFEEQVEKLRIVMGKKTDSINSLSGGNQQKIVLAKWLTANPDIFILDNPTQGVDVGAKEDIYDIILKLAKENIAVVILSSEAKEIIRICDRALVMYHGIIQGELSRDEMTEHEIMRLATGARANSGQEGA
ncbi:Ribose ABC transport system, ATP-binding protein RbsA (TC 3.A.1.2.1) [Halanaerobium saccharolyticum subsp. saccharolyticum DSM 6643]|uniref:Ribose ABC transport system, ATP-binding protein RbsA (TC 3.A.1.2.1) n=1 Tax=Halanaerobium saccharolyticum subsp. saccharolyticum DSM 6643 TaxID=1293054 RepID=M5EHC1_9FIRM|nr:sugar ABC transporter ATP-binding protein [Halanaerobium saccharolyticum]CCU80862.1 Ribose ABC transport system, ATP-binding protein RbsA (TC 3.A.1.2.1) [Halanaerobium saccharolyticum subsp. saccharolyticum DSM 6643]